MDFEHSERAQRYMDHVERFVSERVVPNEPTYLKANTELDFSTQYDITSHFNVFFEAINLTDNVYHTRGRFDNQTLNVVDYGRSFTLGVRAKL